MATLKELKKKMDDTWVTYVDAEVAYSTAVAADDNVIACNDACEKALNVYTDARKAYYRKLEEIKDENA